MKAKNLDKIKFKKKKTYVASLFFSATMADLENQIKKISSTVDELISSIDQLQKAVDQDSTKTKTNFRQTVANAQKCKNQLKILESKVTNFLSADLCKKLDSVDQQTKQIRTAADNMDCKSMLSGIILFSYR